DPRTRLHIATLGDHIDIVFAEAYLAGRAKRGGGFSDRSQEVGKPGRARFFIFEHRILGAGGHQDHAVGIGDMGQIARDHQGRNDRASQAKATGAGVGAESQPSLMGFGLLAKATAGQAEDYKEEAAAPKKTHTGNKKNLAGVEDRAKD